MCLYKSPHKATTVLTRHMAINEVFLLISSMKRKTRAKAPSPRARLQFWGPPSQDTSKQPDLDLFSYVFQSAISIFMIINFQPTQHGLVGREDSERIQSGTALHAKDWCPYLATVNVSSGRSRASWMKM